MKHFTTKFTALLLSLLLLLTVFPLTAAAEVDHGQYWALQRAYNAAMESGDKTSICAACEDILKLYGNFEDATSCYRSITPILNAAKCYEELGKFDDARRIYQYFQRCYQALGRLTDD